MAKRKKGRGAGVKTIVFGIVGLGGKVSVSIVTEVKAESLMNEAVKKVRRESIVCTDIWGGYDSLMFCGYRHLTNNHRYNFKQRKVYLACIEGFWSFGERGVDETIMESFNEKFRQYIKYMEWRYTNREKDLLGVPAELMVRQTGFFGGWYRITFPGITMILPKPMILP